MMSIEIQYLSFVHYTVPVPREQHCTFSSTRRIMSSVPFVLCPFDSRKIIELPK